jgi:hypothetical protein
MSSPPYYPKMKTKKWIRKEWTSNGRAKIVAILVVASLLAWVLLVVRPFLEPDPESDNAADWMGAVPDIEEIFASKRSSATRLGIRTGPFVASSHRAAAQAERELARAASALDQAHARLAGKRAALPQAELTFARAERRIAVLESRSEDSSDAGELGRESLAPAIEARDRARVGWEQARREESVEQVNLHSAEERLKAAELQISTISSSQ